MAYYRPGDRVGGYPIGPELGEDGSVFGSLSEIGAMDRSYRPSGGYVREGYSLPGYVDDGYERGRPLGGEYFGNAPEYYGAERPMGNGYGREGYGYGREGYGYGREGYATGAYGLGYPPQQQTIVQPPVEYVESESSDLGMGLRDSHFVNPRHPTDYGAGYGRSDLAGYGGASGYSRTVYDDAEMRRLRKELEHERHRKHEFELATAAALGYGLHERYEKNEAEEELERYGRDEKKHHHLFRGD